MARGFTPYYVYDAWGRWVYYIQDADWSSVLGGINPLLYRGYVYDHETGLYYLQSRYYDYNTHRFLNADVFNATGQGFIGNNMFAYCRNNPVTRVDPTGNRDNNIWSLKNDEMGRELLAWYLYGDGEEFPTQKKHSAYLKKNKLLRQQVQAYLYPIAESLSNGTSVTINTSISVVIENGEDIIGYQYLHGTEASVGGFSMQGKITKLENGDTVFKMRYTWNDVMNPNPIYSSDVAKASLAKRIPFANPTDYEIAISWNDIAILPADGKSPGNPGFGWLVSDY